jgi:hypothetical protein
VNESRGQVNFSLTLHLSNKLLKVPGLLRILGLNQLSDETQAIPTYSIETFASLKPQVTLFNQRVL